MTIVHKIEPRKGHKNVAISHCQQRHFPTLQIEFKMAILKIFDVTFWPFLVIFDYFFGYISRRASEASGSRKIRNSNYGFKLQVDTKISVIFKPLAILAALFFDSGLFNRF